MTYDISTPTPVIAQAGPRFTKNRDWTDGEDAVKLKRTAYLPLANPDDCAKAYKAHLERTRFFPAAVKTQQGWSGLIFRKRCQLNTTSARIQTLARLITPSYQSLDELCEWVVRETLITNFTGLLVDHPDAKQFTGLSAANADELGFRPYITGYSAENILEVTPGIVGTRRKLVKVRLKDDDGSIRELMLNNGIYQVRIWSKVDNQFVPGAIQTPSANGKVLDEIPFVLVSTSDKLTPQPALLQHVVDLNVQHYRISGLMTSVLYFLSAPIPTVRGFGTTTVKDKDGNPIKDETGNDKLVPPNLAVAPGVAWIFPEADTIAEYLEFKGSGSSVIENQLKEIKEELRIAGHSVIAPDKLAPEAPETQMIYRAAETAILAAFARTVGGQVLKTLKLFARFADPAAEKALLFSLNTDFVPQSMTSQDVMAAIALWQAGAITQVQLLHMLVDGEALSAALDIEGEVERTKQETADRPPVEPL